MIDDSTSLSLLDRVRRQHSDAWFRLLHLYGPLVDHWCRGWGAQGADADDLRQEVFRAVTTGLETFRRDRPGDTFRGWLRVIARRKFLDHCRRGQLQPLAQGGSDAQRRFLQVPEAEEAEVEASAEVKRLHHRALDLIKGQFEEHTWRAFWGCAVDGLAPVDVGRDLGMTAVAVRKAKSRVLRRLKEEFGELLG